MIKRISVVAILAIGAINSSAALAQTEWSNATGQTRVRFNENSLAKSGLTLELLDGRETRELERLSPALQIRTDSAIVTGADLRVLFSNVVHEQSLRITSQKAAITLQGLTLTVHQDDEKYIAAVDAKTGKVLLRSDDPHGAFSTVDGELRFDAGALRITEELALKLGDAALEGVAVASLTIDAAFDVVYSEVLNQSRQDDTDRPAPAGAPRGVIGPDVIVGDLHNITSWGSVGGTTAFSVGTTSCNVGDQNLNWTDTNDQNLHPVIGQNLLRYRELPDGTSRFEQIGQAWLKHGFCALQGNICPPCTPAGGGCGDELGVGCSDPYGAGLNGSQGGLGPKFQVNPHTGVFASPHFMEDVTGNAIYKRTQAHIADIDPAVIGPASFFVTGQYVTQDDSAFGNQDNNESYRPLTISGSGTNWNFSLAGTTQREEAGIRAWQDTNARVEELDVRVPNEGLLIAAVEVTALANGNYHYEYAVQNLNSDRAVRSFKVPLPAGALVENIGFHDVDYHSDEPFDGTDWTATVESDGITWTTQAFNENPDANALRWGTMYNFRFDVNVLPATGTVEFGLFKPGTPDTVSAGMSAPVGAFSIADCNDNGILDDEDILNGNSTDCNGNNFPDECEAGSEITTVEYATGFSTPVYVTAAPGDTSRLFVVEQFGTIRILDTVTRNTLIDPFLNIAAKISTGGERGLFAMAFHPDYASNGKFYVSYTNVDGDSELAEYTVSGDPNIADETSEVIIRTIAQDFPNHNGGMIAFGPDGMLYLGLGDGGAADDPFERAQSETSLLGKMLRFDVDNPGNNYIPADNPVSMTLPEVWAKGLRNPWRFSFDRFTGDMYIADVGQSAREEINHQPASSTGGENYGWDCREGNIAAPSFEDFNVGCDPNGAGLTDPIRVEQYGVSGTCSITGGFMYRGCEIPSLSGTYFYADFCGDYIRSFKMDNGAVVDFQDRTLDLQPTSGGAITSIVSFGEDASGEMYIVSNQGSIYKIVSALATEDSCGNGVLDPGEDCENPDGITCDCNCQDKTPNIAPATLDDDFEMDMGWTSQPFGSVTGTWERGVPVDDPASPFDPTTDGDGSGNAYVTGLNNEDVDGGTAALISPAIDTSAGPFLLSFQYFLGLADESGVDRLQVLVSNNGPSGPFFPIMAENTDTGGQWVQRDFFPAELTSRGALPSANTVVMFLINDSGTPSAVEAGIDAFQIAPVVIDDCNVNCLDDADEIASGAVFDCNANGLPDECEVGVDTCDCDENGVNDALDIANGVVGDCNNNGLPDTCDIAAGIESDCDGGPIGDPTGGMAILGSFCAGCHGPMGTGGPSLPGPNIRGRDRTFVSNKLLPPTDHPGGAFVNFTQDDFANIEAFLSDTGAKARPDSIPDSCQSGTLADCNNNGISDGCELAAGTQVDLNFDGLMDDCDPSICPGANAGDINEDGSTDGRDIGLLVDAYMGGSISASQLCSVDFDNNGTLTTADIPGMVDVLLNP